LLKLKWNTSWILDGSLHYWIIIILESSKTCLNFLSVSMLFEQVTPQLLSACECTQHWTKFVVTPGDYSNLTGSTVAQSSNVWWQQTLLSAEITWTGIVQPMRGSTCNVIEHIYGAPSRYPLRALPWPTWCYWSFWADGFNPIAKLWCDVMLYYEDWPLTLTWSHGPTAFKYSVLADCATCHAWDGSHGF